MTSGYSTFSVQSVPWVDFIDWDVQTRCDVLNSLVSFGDDSHTLSNGLSCDWMITCYHDYLKEGMFMRMSFTNQSGRIHSQSDNHIQILLMHCHFYNHYEVEIY